MGCLGFFGFSGFLYFINYNTAFLSYFSFFAFFSFFWIGSISNEMKDERYVENCRNAKAFTYDIISTEIIFLFTTFDFMTKELLTVVVSLCFASVFILYATAFYRFEKM